MLQAADKVSMSSTQLLCVYAGEDHPYAENLGRLASEHGARLDYLDSQL